MVAEGDGGVESLGRWGVEWEVVVFWLWREVREGVGRSHGRESVFGEEVEGWGRGMGMGIGEGVVGGMVGGMEAKEGEWRKLRGIAEGGVGMGVGERVGERRLLE